MTTSMKRLCLIRINDSNTEGGLMIAILREGGVNDSNTEGGRGNTEGGRG